MILNSKIFYQINCNKCNGNLQAVDLFLLNIFLLLFILIKFEFSNLSKLNKSNNTKSTIYMKQYLIICNSYLALYTDSS